MLVVNVEVWPGDDPRRLRVVETVQIVNVSELAGISDYEVYAGGIGVTVEGHRRSDGALSLIHKALSALESAPEAGK